MGRDSLELPETRRTAPCWQDLAKGVLVPTLGAEEETMTTEPVAAQKGPYTVELTAGQPYFWCRCGRSARQPFCDGRHKDTGIEPLRFSVEQTGTYNICGCKATDDAPFCDGAHLLL